MLMTTADLNASRTLCRRRGDDKVTVAWGPRSARQSLLPNPLCLNVIGRQYCDGLLIPMASGCYHCFCQVWQLCVKNALSPGWIVTTCKPVPMPLSMMSVGLRLLSLAQ